MKDACAAGLIGELMLDGALEASVDAEEEFIDMLIRRLVDLFFRSRLGLSEPDKMDVQLETELATWLTIVNVLDEAVRDFEQKLDHQQYTVAP